jgi:cellulose synthase (UDP-forming)
MSDESSVHSVFHARSVRDRSTIATRLDQSLALVASAMFLAYLIWRAVFTLRDTHLILSVPLLTVEVFGFLTTVLYLFALWDTALPVSLKTLPRPTGAVDILIPTYSEPLEILLPTVSAAKAVAGASQVWVLDDGDRPWVRDLAESLDVRYRSRSQGAHAKAGNINEALADCDSEFILILDADHSAHPDLLTRVMPSFGDERLAVVQTPQDFYNLDSFEHQTLRRRTYMEEEVFYRALLSGRNRWNAVFWCGTGAVVRRVALDSVGGVSTTSVTEDIFTTMQLHKAGWHTQHHNEVLARGLAAANVDQYLGQRLRWGQGAMQVLRQERFVTRRGLTVAQRLCYLATLTGWFTAWRTLVCLLIPACTLLTTWSPVNADAWVFLVVLAAVLLVNQLAMARMSRGFAHWRLNLVFDIIRMPTTIRATFTVLANRTLAFTVTPKGADSDKRTRFRASRTLWLLTAFNILSLAIPTGAALAGRPLVYPSPWVCYVSAFWVLCNITLLAMAIRRIRSPRFSADRRRSPRLAMAGQVWWGDEQVELVDFSITGAQIRAGLDDALTEDGELTLTTGSQRFSLKGRLVSTTPHDHDQTAGVRFNPDAMHDAASALTAIVHA